VSIASHISHRPPLGRRSPARPLRPSARKARWLAADSNRRAKPSVDYGDVASVLFVGAVCGLYFGLTCGWQIAVESAQVVAGVVEYPANNPFYMYHIKAWTLLHQLPALLLACGVSERVLSMLIACAASVLVEQALGLITYAFSRDRLVACMVPMLYLATNVCKGCGAVYPLFIVPDEYWTSYGVTGTACTLFVWSLWGLGLRRAAALLCGLAPAVHPALGGWCVLTTAVAMLWSWRSAVASGRREPPGSTIAGIESAVRRPQLERETTGTLTPAARHGRWFAAGLVVTAVSFCVQQFLARGLPAADPVQSKQLLAAFVEGWDNHRVPFPLGSVDCQFGWALLMLCAVVQAWFAEKLPRESRLLLRILLISALGSLSLCALTHFSRWLPLAVMMAMPGRFINLAVIAYPAVLIGLLARGRRVWSIDVLLAGLSLFCLLRTLMLSKQLIYVPAAHKVFIASGLILVYVLASHSHVAASYRVRQFVRCGALACIVVAGWLWKSDLHLAVLLWSAVPVLWLLQRLDRLAWPSVATALRTGTLACLWLAFLVKGGTWLGVGCLLMCHSRRVGPASLRAPAHRNRRRQRWAGARKLAGPTLRSLPQPPSAWRMAAVVACFALVAGPLIQRAQAGFRLFDVAENDPVIVAARQRSGMLLVVPRMWLVQLRTRRAVLLNGEAMNQITYVPESGPAMNHIVKRVYGDDILTPRPQWWQNWGGLMEHSGFELWQARDTADWRRLGREFGFTNVLTGREWKLQLPVVAHSEKLILYGVP